MKRKNLLTATIITFALALTVWTIGATVNLSTIGFSVNEGDVVSAADFNNAFAAIDGNFTDVQAAINEHHSDRPGLSNGHRNTEEPVTATTQEFNSVTIDVPSAGVVKITATGYFQANHQTGGRDSVRAYLSDTSAASNFDNLAIWAVPSALPTDSQYYSTFAITMVDEVASSGSYTYYLNADVASESQPGAVGFGRNNVVATFYPEVYGTVTATSLQSAGAGNEGPSDTTPSE